MLLASTKAGLPDWHLPSLRSSRECDTLRIFLSFLVCSSGFFSRAWSHYIALADLELMWTRLASSSQRPALVLGLKPCTSCLAQGPFCPAGGYWTALEFFSSFLDSWSRSRDSLSRLITFSSPLGL